MRVRYFRVYESIRNVELLGYHTTDHYIHLPSLGKLLKRGAAVPSSGKWVRSFFKMNIRSVVFGAHQILKYEHNIVSSVQCVYNHKQKTNKTLKWEVRTLSKNCSLTKCLPLEYLTSASL